MIYLLGFGERLKYLRLENNLTMEKAAKIVGIAKSTYAGYESEFRQPSLEKLTLFAHYYNVSVDYILNLTDETEINNNAKKLLSRNNLHWDGIPLNEEDLTILIDILYKALINNNKEKDDKAL